MDTHKAFSTLISDIADGNLHHQLTEAVQEIVEELSDAIINDGGKPKAKLSLDLNFQYDGQIVDVKPDFKVNLPKRNRGRSIFYFDSDGHLTRKNPKQPDLPLTDVSSGRGEIRSA